MTTSLLMLALLPVAAAVTAQRATATSARSQVAVRQPLAAFSSPLLRGSTLDGLLPDVGVMVIIGAGLMGLGSVVRRTTST